MSKAKPKTTTKVVSKIVSSGGEAAKKGEKGGAAKSGSYGLFKRRKI